MVKSLDYPRLLIATVWLAGSLNGDAWEVGSLHHFLGRDGANPCGALLVVNNQFYGTTFNSGPNLFGTVFRMNLDGSGFTTLHSFNGLDGANPCSELVVTKDAIYGTTEYSDSSGIGAVFRMSLDGTGFTNLHTFYDSDGGAPAGHLVLLDPSLYGTTQAGGGGDSGTVFRLNVNGSGFTNLYEFSQTNSGTNRDGAAPFGGLISFSNVLYGTTRLGGIYGSGGVFRINDDGSGFTNLYTFSPLVLGTNRDGANPYGTPVCIGTRLYGTAQMGGLAGYGSIFGVNIDGTGFTNLHSFAGTNSANLQSLGAFPLGGLVAFGGRLYGTTEDQSGPRTIGGGTLFRLNPDGSSFETLYRFAALVPNGQFGVQTNLDGAFPRAGLAVAGNALCGTGWAGGSAGLGTLFALTAGNLNIQTAGAARVLRWTDPGLLLQSAPTVLGPFTNVPGASSPFTNAGNGQRQFFRLREN